MKKIASSIFATVLSLAAVPVLAHGGHGATAGSSVMHYLYEPLHAIPAFAPLAIIAFMVWLLRRSQA